jgi:hypothetical protein
MQSTVLALFLAVGAPACADTIISGTADIVPLSLEGQGTFSLQGAGFSFTGNAIISQPACLVVECPPGSPIPDQFTEMSSEDVGVTGNITVGGTSFNYSEFPGSPGDADLFFFFSLSTPGVNPPSHVTLTGPFGATATFFDPAFFSGTPFLFTGSGTVTIDLTLGEDLLLQPVYTLNSMHFDFGSGSSVPEPSLGAIAFAAIAAAGIHRLRRSRN